MGYSPGTALNLLAAGTILHRLRQMTSRIDGVMNGGDIEDIHKMRVASRRLRTALKLFSASFDIKQIKPWRNTVRKVTQSLGEARDTDVQIAFLADRVHSLPQEEYRPGVEALLADLRQYRRNLQDDVFHAMQTVRGKGRLRSLRQAARTLRKQHRHSSTSADLPSADRDHVAKELQDRIRNFLGWEPYVLEPSAGKEHHKMRIAAKRLRYAMETFSALFDDALESPIDTVKHFQTLLGDAHDCDVWVEEWSDRRDRLLGGAGGDSDPRDPGLEFLLEDRRRTRAELFRQFHDAYRQAQAEGFWEALVQRLNRFRQGQAGEQGS